MAQDTTPTGSPTNPPLPDFIRRHRNACILLLSVLVGAVLLRMTGLFPRFAVRRSDPEAHDPEQAATYWLLVGEWRLTGAGKGKVVVWKFTPAVGSDHGSFLRSDDPAWDAWKLLKDRRLEIIEDWHQATGETPRHSFYSIRSITPLELVLQNDAGAELEFKRVANELFRAQHLVIHYRVGPQTRTLMVTEPELLAVLDTLYDRKDYGYDKVVDDPVHRLVFVQDDGTQVETHFLRPSVLQKDTGGREAWITMEFRDSTFYRQVNLLLSRAEKNRIDVIQLN